MSISTSCLHALILRGSALSSSHDGSAHIVTAAGRYGKAFRRAAGVVDVAGIEVDSDRTCSLRGFGRCGISLDGLDGGGLVGVPIAANAEASLTAVSLDHRS